MKRQEKEYRGKKNATILINNKLALLIYSAFLFFLSKMVDNQMFGYYNNVKGQRKSNLAFIIFVSIKIQKL